MIVVMLFNISDEDLEEFADLDLHAEDLAESINDVAMNIGDQNGVWHFNNATEEVLQKMLSAAYTLYQEDQHKKYMS